MTRVTFLSPAGETLAHIDCKRGESVMQAALRAKVAGIEAECGGLLTCATCHVYLSDDQAASIPPPAADEIGMLEFVAAERRGGSRLCCQIVPSTRLPALVVQVADRQY